MVQLMPLIQENPIHPVPVEVTGQRLDPLFHAVEIIVMAEARLHTDSLLARLLMIYFPRMEIENCGALLQLVQPFEKPSRNRIGPKPEIAAASRGNVLLNRRIVVIGNSSNPSLPRG